MITVQIIEHSDDKERQWYLRADGDMPSRLIAERVNGQRVWYHLQLSKEARLVAAGNVRRRRRWQGDVLKFQQQLHVDVLQTTTLGLRLMQLNTAHQSWACLYTAAIETSEFALLDTNNITTRNYHYFQFLFNLTCFLES